MFRVGRYISGKIRPVIVKLHSAWHRRLLIRGSFKLKSYNEHVFVAPDEALEVRRKHQLNRMKSHAERDGKNVVVNDGVLYVGSVCVFTVRDGLVRHQDLHQDG